VRTFALAAIAAALAACSACSAAADADRQPPPGPQPVVTPAGASLEARLTVERPAPAPSGRNPFRFGHAAAAAAAARGAQVRLPPPDGLPELPLPIVTPPLKLLGIAKLTDGARVAVLRVGADLVFAREGETVGNRFRVGRVADSAVELTDAVGDRLVRLDLP
jgi:hypothetical protein